MVALRLKISLSGFELTKNKLEIWALLVMQMWLLNFYVQ